MSRALAAAAALGLALAGCGEGEEAAAPVKSIRIANPHDEQLRALSEPMRHLGLMRAIRDSGNRCKKVEAAAPREQYKGLAAWVARCSDSGLWSVFIAPTGDLQVRDCDQSAELGLPACSLPEGEEKAG